MTVFSLIFLNVILYLIFRVQIIRKLRKNYTVSLQDSEGNTQSLSDTIAFLLEQNKIQEKRLMFLAKEMETQWANIEFMKDRLNISDNDYFQIPEETNQNG